MMMMSRYSQCSHHVSYLDNGLIAENYNFVCFMTHYWRRACSHGFLHLVFRIE